MCIVITIQRVYQISDRSVIRKGVKFKLLNQTQINQRGKLIYNKSVYKIMNDENLIKYSR